MESLQGHRAIHADDHIMSSACPLLNSVVTFIVNYNEQHSLALPGCIPGYSRTDVQLLPSSTSKKSIWDLFQSSRPISPSNQSVAYSTLCRLWRTLVPNVITMKSIRCQISVGLASRTAPMCWKKQMQVREKIPGLKECTGAFTYCKS